MRSTEAMLRRAPARFARIVMDSTRLALAAGSIDVIVTTFMFQHLEDPVGVLGSVRALLRGGGSMGLATWGTGETFPAMDVWDEELDRLGVPAAPGPQPAGRERTNAVEKMVSALDEAGFVDATSESVEWRRMWELDEFVEWRGVLGPSGRRLSLLDPTERERVVDAARQRVVTAGPEALRHRDEVLLSVARSPS
jgi:SAM-dependent methyltransferase